MSMTTKTSDEAAAKERLAEILDECAMEVAEMTAVAEETYLQTLARARALRARIGRVSRMAGLGDLPEWSVERRVRKVAS